MLFAISSVREFVVLAFKAAGLDITFKGKGIEEASCRAKLRIKRTPAQPQHDL